MTRTSKTRRLGRELPFAPNPSGAPAMYVIETRAGFAERHGITPGAFFAYTPAAPEPPTAPAEP